MDTLGGDSSWRLCMDTLGGDSSWRLCMDTLGGDSSWRFDTILDNLLFFFLITAMNSQFPSMDYDKPFKHYRMPYHLGTQQWIEAGGVYDDLPDKVKPQPVSYSYDPMGVDAVPLKRISSKEWGFPEEFFGTREEIFDAQAFMQNPPTAEEEDKLLFELNDELGDPTRWVLSLLSARVYNR